MCVNWREILNHRAQITQHKPNIPNRKDLFWVWLRCILGQVCFGLRVWVQSSEIGVGWSRRSAQLFCLLSGFINPPIVVTFCICSLSSRSKLTHSHWRSKIKQFYFMLNAKSVLHKETTCHSWETVNIRVFSFYSVERLNSFSGHHSFLFQHSCHMFSLLKYTFIIIIIF